MDILPLKPAHEKIFAVLECLETPPFTIPRKLYGYVYPGVVITYRVTSDNAV